MDSCGYGCGQWDSARSCRTEYCVEHESQQRYEQRGLVPFQTIRNYCQKIQQIRKKFIQEKVEPREGAGCAGARSHWRDSGRAGEE